MRPKLQKCSHVGSTCLLVGESGSGSLVAQDWFSRAPRPAAARVPGARLQLRSSCLQATTPPQVKMSPVVAS